MYLNKYGFGNGTYVKLDELNDLMKAERRKRMKEAKLAHKAGDSDTKMRFVYEHGALIDLGRKVNMSEDGEKYIIFTRDKDGEWEYFVELVKFDEIPAFVRRHMTKSDEEYAAVGTNDIDEATLYDCHEDAEDALAEIEAECAGQAVKWHITKRWMFDTEDNRDSLLRLFYDGGKEKDEKPDENAAAISMTEDAIERTRAALDRTEKLLSKVKGGESEKPSEAPQNPKTRTVMNRKGAKRCPARYTVWYRDDSDVTTHCMGFVRFEDGIPVFTNRPCKACWFVWRGMAETVAQKCGDGFEVVDMIGQMTAEERLLRAIFREDGMDGDEEPEYHGDGTRAEDEDWEDE